MAATHLQVPGSVLLDADYALSLAMEPPRESLDAVTAILQVVRGRRSPIECARALCEARLERHPWDTRALLRALDLLDEALDRVRGASTR